MIAKIISWLALFFAGSQRAKARQSEKDHDAYRKTRGRIDGVRPDDGVSDDEFLAWRAKGKR